MTPPLFPTAGPMSSAAQHGRFVWPVLALVALAGCRDTRPLEEMEAALTAELPPLPADGDPDPMRRGLLRMERLWVRGGERIMEEGFPVALGGEYPHGIELAAGDCVAVYAWGEGSGLDLDLELQSPGGWPVASETALDAFPVIPRYCATEAGRYTVRTLAVEGSGQAMIAASRLAGEPWAGQSARLAALVAEHLAGFSAAGPPQQAYHEQGYTWETPLALLHGRCYAVVAVADDGVSDLDLDLLGPDELSVRRDIGTDAQPFLMPFCPSQAGIYRMRARFYQGGGRIWWQLFEGSGEGAPSDAAGSGGAP